MIRGLTAFLFTLTFCALLCCGCGNKEDDSAGQTGETGSVGNTQQAPGFRLKDLNGETVDFADYKGKLVLVDFWATWCGPCRRSIPHLADLFQEYRDQGFEVVGVSLDRSQPSKVKDYARAMSIPYKIVVGSQKDADNWNTGPAIPVAFLVSRSGEIVNRFVGYQRKSVLEEEIRKYL